MNRWTMFKVGFALVIVVHAFVHLAIVPGMESEDGEALGWSGESWLLGGSLDDDALWNLGLTLTALTIVFYIVATLGLLGVPVLKRLLVHSTAVATAMSLSLFVIIWDGIEPDPMAAIFGPITTLIVMIVVLAGGRIETALSPKTVQKT